jgi:hypothetical protein
VVASLEGPLCVRVGGERGVGSGCPGTMPGQRRGEREHLLTIQALHLLGGQRCDDVREDAVGRASTPSISASVAV